MQHAQLFASASAAPRALSGKIFCERRVLFSAVKKIGDRLGVQAERGR